MSPETYEILAVKYAERTDRRRVESFLAADDHDAPHPIDFFIWVIRNPRRTIVVDTGFDETEGRRRQRTLLRAPSQALAMVGIAAEARGTGRHHAPALGSCRNAGRFRQRALPPAGGGDGLCDRPLHVPPHLRATFTADHVCEMVRKVYSGRVVFHDGDAEIAPGVTVHKLGGHSRGLQCVRVMTETGPVVLASDGTHFYENFETGKVFPIVVDVEDVLDGYARMETLAASPRHIVPGHDPLVLQRYPALNSQTQGVVHRVDLPRLDA